MTTTKQTADQIEKTIQVFGMKNPRYATITRDVKTKLGLAFKKGDTLVKVYETGLIESGPYTGEMGFSAYSLRNDVMTALRPTHFKPMNQKGGAR